ncbi:MAG: protein kinase [Thermoanaerobaculales bacterium]
MQAGTSLGPYEIVAPIGAGGMGEVYRARDTRLGRDVAIKVLPAEFAEDPERLRRFEREAKATAALSHPNILDVHDVGTFEGVPYLVEELLEGESLKERIERGALAAPEALGIAVQMARGLAAAHEKGIVHRDLKPANVFLTRQGAVKILDFGLAKLVEGVPIGEADTLTHAPTGATEFGRVLGTVAYMAPEQARGIPVDARADVFAFGVVLYEMVAGERPFRGKTASDTVAAILTREPAPLPASVPPDLVAVIGKCLAKEPEKRYLGGSEVLAALGGVDVEGAAPLWGPLHRSVRRHPWLAAAIGGAGWLLHRASRERWALKTTSEIARLVEAEEFTKAAALIRDARAILPKDATLQKLWNSSTREATIESAPTDADVSIRPYRGDSNAGESLGKTPIKRIRLPRGVYVWRISKPGFATMQFLAGAGIEDTFRLRPEGTVPPEMVPVAGGKTRVQSPSLQNAPEVLLADYLIDRTEVTNEEYKTFVDAGGYQRREFWKQPFVKNGRPLPREEAAALFVDTTGRPGPSTWEVGSYPKGLEKHPVAGVSWYEAAAFAEFAGKNLPTAYHWTYAAEPWFAMLIVPGSNLRGTGTQPVGGPGTLSGYGTTDMAGNVKERCWNEGREGKRYIMGGGFGEPDYMFFDCDAQSPWERRPNFGFRCVKLPELPPPAAAARLEPSVRDFSMEKPVSDEVFKAFKSLYAYDKGELNARVEETETTEDWTRVKVSFDAAYGGERVVIHLYLPKGTAPPFQTVVFFPGSGAIFQDKLDTSALWDNSFVLKGGRALLFPIYKSTFERRDGLKSDIPNTTASWRDHMIAWSKDLGRSLDYLQTRKDIDSTRMAYLGLSWGSAVAPVLLAVDERFRAAILLAGGLAFEKALPEAEPINFVPRVKLPVLMLNGRLDNFYPMESSGIPLFRLLGTPDSDKPRVVCDSGHMPPRPETIRESLNWLDKYLGPVKQ